MPQPQLEKFDQRAIVIALAETTLINAVHGLRLLDGEASVESDAVARNIDTPYLGAKPSVRTNFRANIAGTLELIPPVEPGHATLGIPPTNAGLVPCGLSRTISDLLGLTRYNVISRGFQSCDANWWHAGLYIEARGLRGDLSQIRSEIGQTHTARMALQGAYNQIDQQDLPTDVDMSAFSSPTVSEPENSFMIISSEESPTPLIDELHLRAKSLITNLGHTVAQKRFTEYRETGINQRAATATAVFARPDFDEFNPDEYFRSGRCLIFTYKIVEPDGRYSAHRVRLEIGSWSGTNVDGDLCISVQGSCIPSEPVGNDEVQLIYGDDTFRIRGDWPGATQNVVYVPGAGIAAAGEFVGPVTYAVTAGALPTGLVLSAGGLLTGTATTVESATFTVTATDSTAVTPKTATKQYTVAVTA